LVSKINGLLVAAHASIGLQYLTWPRPEAESYLQTASVTNHI